MRILKTATCSSLSGKSKLSYQIGTTDDGQVNVRVTDNSSSGCFNDEWVSLRRIVGSFDRNSPGNTPVTSGAIIGLFEGKSQNTPGFVFAALKAEGFVQASAHKKGRYDRLDAAAHAKQVKSLLAGERTPTTAPKAKALKAGSPAEPKKPSKTTKKKA